VDSRQGLGHRRQLCGRVWPDGTATAIDIAITRKATDNTLVDYAAQSLAVQTSTTANPSTMTLDLAANLGEVTRASGNLTVDAFGFFRVSGALALNKNTTTRHAGRPALARQPSLSRPHQRSRSSN
jgi:hypothetical protein